LLTEATLREKEFANRGHLKRKEYVNRQHIKRKRIR